MDNIDQQYFKTNIKSTSKFVENRFLVIQGKSNVTTRLCTVHLQKLD